MLKPQSITVEKLLRQYEEGRITATGVMLTVLTITSQQRLREMLEALPAEILEKLKGFVAAYEPGRQVFNAPSPKPRAVRLVRDWFHDRLECTAPYAGTTEGVRPSGAR